MSLFCCVVNLQQPTQFYLLSNKDFTSELTVDGGYSNPIYQYDANLLVFYREWYIDRNRDVRHLQQQFQAHLVWSNHTPILLNEH